MTQTPNSPTPSTSIEYLCDPSFCREELRLINCLVIKIEDKKQISKILPKLPVFIKDYSHLKRIKDGEIIVGGEHERETVEKLLAVLDVSSVISTISVPSDPPLTRFQFNQCQEVWPVHFRENTELEKKLADKYFDKHRKAITDLAIVASESDGCVIVDGVNLKVLAKASESLSNFSDPLKHPFMRALEAFCPKIGRKRSAGEMEEQYLCTNCYVILEHEPCAMCAMAMVHSRVKNVFFVKPSSNGALVSNCQLHLNPNLNHHYDVFRLNC